MAVKKNNGHGGRASAVIEPRPAALTAALEGMKGALDSLGANVFVADRDLTLVYMNRRGAETMKSIGDTVEKLFGVSPDELIGARIDAFDGARGKQIRRTLSDPGNLPIRTEIKLGELILDLNVNAILSGDGSYIGLVVNWEEISGKHKTEEDAARAESMMDNSPINVLYADTDLVLRYMNPASKTQLLRLEQYLPVRVSEMIGKSIDVFHKDPAYQRRLLGDPKNLPRRANIKVGPETLDLLVSPIFDKKNSYLGAMVTWEVITKRLESEKRQAEQGANATALSRVMGALTEATSIQDAAKAALDTIRTEFEWAYGSYWIVDEKDNALKFAVESGAVNDEFRRVTMGSRFREGEGLSGRAWKTRDLFFTEDIGQMTDCSRAPVAQRAGVKSGVCFPITLGGKVVGTMDFFSMVTLTLSKERLDALRSVGGLVSQAFDRIKQVEQQVEQGANAAALSRVMAALTEAASIQEAARAALDTIRSEFEWAYGSYWIVDEKDNALKFAVESGSVNDEFRRVTMESRFREGEGLSGRAWKTRDLFCTEDIGKMTDCSRAPVAQRAGVKSGVCFPIMIAGKVVGTMDFFSMATLTLSKERLDALRSVGGLVSQAFDRINAIERDRAAQQELRTKVTSILSVVQMAAQGDLTQEVTIKGSDTVGQMGEELSSFFRSLRHSMSQFSQNAQSLASSSEELTAISQQMAGNAEETATQANVVSAASEQVSKNVDVVATGSEEMLASIREIAKSANESARVAKNAVIVAETANQTISKLGESSVEIGKVIKVITSIAQQTNLLALNATIEAARAGEAGKGFAVVANEVKELAKATAKATEEIGQKIEAIQGDTKAAVKAIAEISAIINQINDISNTIASAVEEQTATTNEIGRNVNEAAKGTGEIAKNISGVATAAQSTTAGANDTQGAAKALSAMAVQLQTLVGKFKI